MIFFNSDHAMHKNKLQEYAQKCGLPLPVYTTNNRGFVHKPMFQSTVLVDGMEYRSEQRFSRVISAENDVAKIALDCIKKNMKIAGPSSIHMQEPKVSKSILYEFAVKSKVEVPTYKTTSAEEAEAVFVSTCTFKGKSYTSEIAGSKKMAEQYAARKAIQALVVFDSGNVLSQIIKSKTIANQAQGIYPPCVKADHTTTTTTTTTQYGGGVMGVSSSEKRKVEANNRGANNRGAKRVRIAKN